MSTPENLDTITIGRTIYTVERLAVGENSAAAGVRARFTLTGPNGAAYFVTDYGPEYRINSTCVGGSRSQRWTPAPRPLRGLTRAHLAPFLTD